MKNLWRGLIAVCIAAFAAARADSALGNMGAAYERFWLHRQYADSLNDARQNREIGRLEAEFQFGKRLEARRRAEAGAAEQRARYAAYAAIAFAVYSLNDQGLQEAFAEAERTD